MSIFVGTEKICGASPDSEIRRILRNIALPKIGELKYMTTPATVQEYGENDDIYKKDLPTGFDGWLYASGCKILKSEFSAVAEVLEKLSYEGKEDQDGWIRIPNLNGKNRFFKITASNSSNISAYTVGDAECSMPAHIHNLGDNIATTEKRIVKNCAYVWSTRNAESDVKDATMPRTSIDYDGVTLDIPPAPAAHRGGTGEWVQSSKDWYYVSWDVPIDTQYQAIDTKIKCKTGENNSSSASVWPKHVIVPVMIYVGT